MEESKTIECIALNVQKEFQMGGLADGIYLDFASEVAKRYASIAVSKERERIVEGIKSLEEMIAVKDNDSHRYQIPQSRYHEWEDFCNIPSDDEKSWDVPEWAERIDGMPVTSLKQSVINLINTK